MPDVDGKFRGISVPELPWHRDEEKEPARSSDEDKASWGHNRQEVRTGDGEDRR